MTILTFEYSIERSVGDHCAHPRHSAAASSECPVLCLLTRCTTTSTTLYECDSCAVPVARSVRSPSAGARGRESSEPRAR
eukprot:6542262-Prymnesium_polylepis.2